jgi:diguanylate cyclase (GGDEF)-like protein/PAS domain S-box-containing protein
MIPKRKESPNERFGLVRATAGVLGTLAVALTIAFTIIHFYTWADARRSAETQVQTLAGVSFGTYSTTGAAVRGAPVRSVRVERERIDQMIPGLLAGLGNIGRDVIEVKRFREAFDAYHAIADMQWLLLKAEDRAGAADLTPLSESSFQAMEGVAVAAEKTLESSAISGVRRANAIALLSLILVSLLALYLAVRIGRVRTREAQRRTHERALRESEERFRALVSRATDMITVIDQGGIIRDDSPAVERMLGWAPGERVGRPRSDFIHLDDRNRMLTLAAELRADPGSSRTAEFRERDAQGNWRWIEGTATNLLDEPTVAGFVSNYRIIDERKALEAELTHRALHDTLTKLANRALFRDRVDAALSRRDVGRRPPAVLFIDVDDFKHVNDGFGHAAGDRLLIEIADRLRNSVRPEDLVARLGGDEFAILVEEGSNPTVVAAEVADRVIEQMREPFAVAGRHVSVEVSIGIAVYDPSATDTDDLLRHADTAMYTAKAHGKARFEIFSEEMNEISERSLEPVGAPALNGSNAGPVAR